MTVSLNPLHSDETRVRLLVPGCGLGLPVFERTRAPDWQLRAPSEIICDRLTSHYKIDRIADARDIALISLHKHAEDLRQASLLFYHSARKEDYMSLSCGLHSLLSYLFAQQDFHRVGCFVHTQDNLLTAVLRENKMRREGLIRRHRLYGDKWCDEFLYGVLEEEWDTTS